MSKNNSGDHPVLIVEDDQDVRQALGLLLIDEGYNVLSAGNGLEALNLLKGNTAPCLIVLDLMMPVMDGWTFLAQRAIDPAPLAVPVVVVTAHLPVPGEPQLEVASTIQKAINVSAFLDVVNAYC